MEKSSRYRDDAKTLLSSLNSSITTPTRPITTISESTTFVQTDVSSFKQVVQMLTGSSSNPNPTHQPDPRYLLPPIRPVLNNMQSSVFGSSNFPNPTHQPDPTFSFPPIRPVPDKNQSSSSSGFRIYERRKPKTHLEVNPVRSGLPDRPSPSTLDFPSLLLSPDTPLLPDPFNRTGSKTRGPTRSGFEPYDPRRGSDVEEREIREKGFYLHPSPSSTSRDPEPRLLPLFPLTSPRASESLPNST